LGDRHLTLSSTWSQDQVLILTGADKIATQPLPEVMEHAVSVLLHHLCVDVEAGVAELSDLLGEQLHTLRRVAEDDRLVDL